MTPRDFYNLRQEEKFYADQRLTYTSNEEKLIDNSDKLEMMKLISRLQYDVKRLELKEMDYRELKWALKEEAGIRKEFPAVAEAYKTYQVLLNLAKEGK